MLCLRWLLHLDGKTFVEGLPDDDYFFEDIIPNVQFTPKYLKELQGRSTNSLDDFALSFAAGYEHLPHLPTVESAWTNSPLLPWMTLQMSWMATETHGTNPIPQSSLNSALSLMHLAQMAKPDNGAFWQAEARVDIGAHDNGAALRALWTAAQKGKWNAGEAGSFSELTNVLLRAGLSELDAVTKADEQFPSAMQHGINGFLDVLMTQSVHDDQPQEFLKLLQLLVELRRGDWVDEDPRICNVYREFSGSRELTEAMAAQLKINLATNWTELDLDYGNYHSIRHKVFEDYLNRYADPVTMVTFNSQAEADHTEQNLRDQLSEADGRAMDWPMLGAQIAGVGSLVMISLLCLALTFEALTWYLVNKIRPSGRLPRDLKFWLFALAVVIFNSLLLANLWFAFKFGSEPGDGPIEPPPLFNLDGRTLLVSFFYLLICLGGLLWEWKEGKLEINRWRVIRLFGCFYLVCVIMMAFFRHQYVMEISSHYQ